jgi:hypothetical protein
LQHINNSKCTIEVINTSRLINIDSLRVQIASKPTTSDRTQVNRNYTTTASEGANSRIVIKRRTICGKLGLLLSCPTPMLNRWLKWFLKASILLIFHYENIFVLVNGLNAHLQLIALPTRHLNTG